MARRRDHASDLPVMFTEPRQAAAPRIELGHDAGEGFLVDQPGEVPKRFRDARPIAVEGAGQHTIPRLDAQLRRRALVDHRKVGRDGGLQREAPEERFTKGVNGPDLEPLGHLQGEGEKAARPGQHLGRRRMPQKRLDLVSEHVVGRHGPVAETRVEPVFHLGGGGLGEGQAQDAPGRRAGRQQAGDALDEHVGLAGPGVGRHPHRTGGVAGRPRPLIGFGAAPGGGGHSPSPPRASHSLTRARWS